jgi:hypothetical protein
MRICLKHNNFDIEIFDGSAFNPNRDSSTSYNKIYWQEEDQLYSPSSKHAVEVYKEGQKIESAILLGIHGTTSVTNDCYVLSDDSLTIRCSHKIYSFSIPSLQLHWMTQADWATCFSIHRYKDSFITHGELSICRFDFNGNKLWSFGGRDIFISLYGPSAFTMCDDFIELTDFNGSRYKIDYDGNEIEHNESDYYKRPAIPVTLKPRKPWWRFW